MGAIGLDATFVFGIGGPNVLGYIRHADNFADLFNTFRGVRNASKVLSSGKTVIGKVGQYEPLAEELGANYFKVSNEVWNSLDREGRWALNRAFLDEAVKRGDEFILATPLSGLDELNTMVGFYGDELRYLNNVHGYNLSADGTRMFR